MTGSERLGSRAEDLLVWFAQNARDLPWRKEPTPYHVWVSEIMLQQTRVEAVKPFYTRFVTELPDIKALADCPEERLLKLWEGLGYYSRVRNMQKAAKKVVESYDGKLPADRDQLLALPGFGPYTSGSVASIAYGLRAPAVDGNVLRVITRMYGDRSDIKKTQTRKAVEAIVTEAMPEGSAGAFNQALMEIGATVCVPNGDPACAICPLARSCKAGQDGSWSEIPVKTAKTPRRIEARTVLVVRDGVKTWIRRRPEKGLLAGLYELPSLDGHRTPDEVLEELKRLGLAPVRIQPLREAKHIFSHVEWRMIGFMILVESLDDTHGLLCVEPQRTEEEYPIPAAFRAYTEYLRIRIGQDRYRTEE